MPPKMRTFPRAAHLYRQAQNADPTLDPVDLIAAAHPQLADYQCIALPMVPCAESVLRLALSVDLLGEDPSTFELETRAPPLLTRCPNATIAELTRRLERLGKATFPVYTLMPPGAVPGPPEFALVSPRMRPRPDHWAILYVPPGAAPAHWTFTTIIPPPEEEEDVVPTIVYTSMPITDPSPRIYWRCHPTRANMQAYTDKRALGSACHCCQLVLCPHEYLFRRAYPNHRVLVLERNLCFDAAWRGQVVSATNVDSHRVLLGAKGVVTVVNAAGQKSDHPQAWNHDTVLRPAVDNGSGMKPWVMDSWCVSAGALEGMPRFVSLFARMSMRVGHTWMEKLFPFYYWKYDVPRQTVDVTIRPYKLRLYELERRRRGLKGTLFTIVGSLTLSGLYANGAYQCFRLACKSNNPVGILGLAYCSYSCFCWTIKSWKSAFYSAVSLPAVLFLQHFKCTMDLRPGERAFGNVTGSSLISAKHEEINSRLAVKAVITRNLATDVFRRAMNETKWANSVTPEEFESWLDTVVNTPGETMCIPPNRVGYCVTCKVYGKTYRQECRSCKLKRNSIPPEPLLSEPLVTYVGRIGLWSRHFTPPQICLKEDVVIRRGKTRFHGVQSVLEDLDTFETVLSCRGWNSGPMIDGNLPQCFPRGYPTAVIGFMIRLGAARLHEPVDRVWDLWYKLIRGKAVVLEPESRDKFLEHFSGEKLRKMLEAFQNIDEGYAHPILNEVNPVCSMKGFQKAEKSYSYKLASWSAFTSKGEEKPRFICCPSPEFLAEIGPYTHAQLKWLSHAFPATNHMFYAGCATPVEMNEWLNWTLSEIAQPVTITDDITAIDSNHNGASFEAHARLRRLQFPYLKRRIRILYDAEENIVVRVGPYTLAVSNINASGVSDTSYKNSAPCLLLRVLAIVHAVFSIHGRSDEEVLALFRDVLRLVFTSAAGDDGITRLPRVLFGVDVLGADFRAGYEDLWAMAGFSVKVQTFPEHRWRMATYLAMRPVWAGKEYQWAPEPARRLKGMFWQIDNSMHPTAWGRGVATQVYQQGQHCPVLGDICEWYLENTHGPIGEVEEKLYSPWNGYVTDGRSNERAEREFMADYHIEKEELQFMRKILGETKSVYVNLGFSALRKVMLEES